MNRQTAGTIEPAPREAPPAIFNRVLVGVDGSPESREAARQAARLARGHLMLLAAWDVKPQLVGATGMGAPVYVESEDMRRAAAEDALRRTRALVEPLMPAAGTLVHGTAWQELIREIERRAQTLVAVGSHGGGRMRGIVLGSTATTLVHRAPCSVLIARGAGDDFPRRVAVGVDGSPQSAAAFAVARHLADRFSAELWPVVARGGNGVDQAAVAAIVDTHEDLPDDPVHALAALAAEVDLLVVGSRGLHGLKALGSVSERVAHRAQCSTLIVR